jgi:membrane peptidoglycan carboxypeptidase
MVNPKKEHRSKEHKSTGQVIKLGLKLMLLLFLILVAVGIFYFYHAYGRTIFALQAEAKRLVSASTSETFRASQTSLVYDTDGELISTLKAEKDVYYIEYQDIPEAAIDAILTSEDKKFMQHDGVDYLANLRAAIALIKHKGEITQGASTITQQLARNIFLSNEVTYERKIEEIFIAQELEKKYSKADILEYYFNNIYFANGHYGILAAANGYFSKGVSQLSLSQLIFLCSIPNNPTIYNPVKNMENTLDRRDRILKQLYEDHKINQDEYSTALAEKIELKPSRTEKKNYVETYVYYSAIRALMAKEGFVFRNQFTDELDQDAYEQEYEESYYRHQKQLYTYGYRIYTSIDLTKQKLLQKTVDRTLKDFTDKNEEGVYKLQGAAVCIDNDSGRVVAIVGGRNQELEGYTLNRAFQSYRQPGSSIKPLIVYTPAFERGYYPNSKVVDEKFEGGPKNSTGNYAGEMKLQRAIEQSKNTVAWKLFEELTPTTGLSYLMKMNFARLQPEDYYPAAALGGFTVGVSPLEMASAYAALENDGTYRNPTCIVKIMDSEGNEIVGDDVITKQIYQTKAARMMTEALTGVIKNGTGKGLGLTNTISAGKTGTTDERKDGWFVGYTPYYTTSVWVGCDMPQAIEELAGSSYPGTIWHDYMEQLHDSTMKKAFSYYDWRTEYQQKLEAEKAAAEAAMNEQNPEEASGVDGNPNDPESNEESTEQDSLDNTEGNDMIPGEDGEASDGAEEIAADDTDSTEEDEDTVPEDNLDDEETAQPPEDTVDDNSADSTDQTTDNDLETPVDNTGSDEAEGPQAVHPQDQQDDPWIVD